MVLFCVLAFLFLEGGGGGWAMDAGCMHIVRVFAVYVDYLLVPSLLG